MKDYANTRNFIRSVPPSLVGESRRISILQGFVAGAAGILIGVMLGLAV